MTPSPPWPYGADTVLTAMRFVWAVEQELSSRCCAQPTPVRHVFT
jgi:hypothetical protein